MRVWYMAHPIAPDERYTFQQNMDHVLEMLHFFLVNGVYVIAPYHTMCLVLPDDNPEYRKLGLAVDVEVVQSIGSVVMVGHKVSSGMKQEEEACNELGARGLVLDCTTLSRKEILFYIERGDFRV